MQVLEDLHFQRSSLHRLYEGVQRGVAIKELLRDYQDRHAQRNFEDAYSRVLVSSGYSKNSALREAVDSLKVTYCMVLFQSFDFFVAYVRGHSKLMQVDISNLEYFDHIPAVCGISTLHCTRLTL